MRWLLPRGGTHSDDDLVARVVIGVVMGGRMFVGRCVACSASGVRIGLFCCRAFGRDEVR
jgi:hypothetical protein